MRTYRPNHYTRAQAAWRYVLLAPAWLLWHIVLRL